MSNTLIVIKKCLSTLLIISYKTLQQNKGKSQKFNEYKSDSGPVYGDNDKYIKSKTKLSGDKINTNF